MRRQALKKGIIRMSPHTSPTIYPLYSTPTGSLLAFDYEERKAGLSFDGDYYQQNYVTQRVFL